MEAANRCRFLMLCAILAAYLALSSSTALDFFGGDHRQLGLVPIQSECRGSIGECTLWFVTRHLLGAGFVDSSSRF
jgi:hypothetical protein